MYFYEDYFDQHSTSQHWPVADPGVVCEGALLLWASKVYSFLSLLVHDPTGTWRFQWETWVCLTPLRSTTEVSSSPTWRRPWLNWVTTCSASSFICTGENHSISQQMFKAFSTSTSCLYSSGGCLNTVSSVLTHSSLPPLFFPAWFWLWSTTEAPRTLSDPSCQIRNSRVWFFSPHILVLYDMHQIL